MTICISPQDICISPENQLVFPQPGLCSDPWFEPLFTYQDWERAQLFHNHTITQTMRKNANMVLRCQNSCDADDVDIFLRISEQPGPWNQNFSILVYPKSSPFAHAEGIIPITVRPKCWLSCQMGASQVTVSNNNPEGWSTGVVVLVVAIICSMAFAIFGNLIGLVSNDRFWGSVHAGETNHHLGPLI